MRKVFHVLVCFRRFCYGCREERPAAITRDGKLACSVCGREF